MNRRDLGRYVVAGLGSTLRAEHASQEAALLPQAQAGKITDIDGVRVGHFTESRRPTGCTALIFDDGTTAGVDVRGSAAGTRGTEAMGIQHVTRFTNAIVLSGGSEFGLDTVSGVARYLEERGSGLHAGKQIIPLVGGAILFDLAIGDGRIRPDAQAGYMAAQAARTGDVAEGNVGAGAGATIGKMFGMQSAMKSGLGTASLKVGNTGIVVGAIVAVNAVGDVYDPSLGCIVAGARSENGESFRNTLEQMRTGLGLAMPEETSKNTTIAVVATNAKLDRVQATKVAQMAHDGMARAINPVHTLWDGDTVFAVSTGKHSMRVNHGAIGSLAADVLAQAILRAVKSATSLPGLPAFADINKRSR